MEQGNDGVLRVGTKAEVYQPHAHDETRQPRHNVRVDSQGGSARETRSRVGWRLDPYPPPLTLGRPGGKSKPNQTQLNVVANV